MSENKFENTEKQGKWHCRISQMPSIRAAPQYVNMKMERLLLILRLYMRLARFFRSQFLSWLLIFRKQPVSLSVRPEEVGKVLSFRRNDYISTSMTDDINARKMASLIFMRRKVNPESTKRLWRFALSPLTEAAARFSTPDEFFIVIC